MLQDDFDLLALMLRDQEGVDSLYKPGPYWQGYQRRVASALQQHGVNEFRRHPAIGKGFADTRTIDPFSAVEQTNWKHQARKRIMGLPGFRRIEASYLKLIRHWSNEALRYRSMSYEALWGDILQSEARKWKFPDSLAGGCEDVVTIGGVRYAKIYVDFMLRMLNFSAMGVNFSNCTKIFEIGGGFGAMVHLLASANPSIRKILYLDIPPMVYVATQYLKYHFGNAVIDYRSSRDLSAIRFADNDSIEIFCLCPWQIGKVEEKGIDLLWNSGSFSEMTPDIVRNYAYHAKRTLDPKHAQLCLLLNKMEKHPEYEVTLPSDVVQAFAPEFVVEPANATHEIQSGMYWIGKPT